MEVAMKRVLFTALTVLALSACATSGGIMADNPQADTERSPTGRGHPAASHRQSLLAIEPEQLLVVETDPLAP